MKANICVFAAAAAILSGCVGDFFQPKVDTAKFYIFRAPEGGATKAKKFSGNAKVNLLPFTLPAYMGRHQIVSSDGSSGVTISEFHRWAELPAAGFNRALVEGISAHMPGADLYDYPSVSASVGALTLRLFVEEFIGELDSEVWLMGRWQISGSSPADALDRKFDIKIKCDGSYDSYVSAMNAAIFHLSGQIAEGISEFASKNKK